MLLLLWRIIIIQMYFPDRGERDLSLSVGTQTYTSCSIHFLSLSLSLSTTCLTTPRAQCYAIHYTIHNIIIINIIIPFGAAKSNAII